MSGFDKREEGFEKKFAHDEELRFRAHARRNKMVGLWAAQKLGLAGAAAETYANGLVESFVNASTADLAGKLRKDFDANGVVQSDHQISRMLDELMATAMAEIKAGR